jgi:hypothetical protein
MSVNNRYFSPKQISEIYGIPLNKIYYLVRLGRIAYIKPSEKLLLIPEREFVEFLELNIVDRR